MQLRTKSLAVFSLLLALSQVLGFLEHLLPVFSVIPGGKIGLANIVTMVVFSAYGTKKSLAFGMLRSALSAMLFGGVFSFFYSGAGTVLCVLFMGLFQKLFKQNVSYIGLSMVGASFFNLGQILVCMLVLKSVYVVQYLSVLLVISAFAGLITGYLSEQVIKIQKSNKKQNGVEKSWK